MAIVAVCALVAASCGGSDDSETASSHGAAPTETTVHEPDIAAPVTVWDEFLAEMDDDGRVSKDTALEAFALAYGPIPEVEIRAGDPGAVASMTARSWLSHHLDELTFEQTEAVHAALESLDAEGRPASEWHNAGGDAMDGDSLGTGGVRLIGFSQEAQSSEPKSCWGGPITLADAPGTEKFRPLLNEELTELTIELGPLGIPVYLAFGAEKGTVLADASPWNADCDQPAVACRVRLRPKAVEDFVNDEDNLRVVLLHELVHCYQGARAPVNNVRNSKPWLIEGFPMFAMRDLHPEISTLVNRWWRSWFSKPGLPLVGRSYDAVGFFVHLAAVGADPWASFEAALATTDSTEQFEIFVRDVRVDFEETWASSVSRQPDRGPAWDDGLPGMPRTVPTRQSATITDTTTTGYRTLPFGIALVDLVFEADLIVIEPISGQSRLGWGNLDEIVLDTDGADAVYCAASGGCECPSGKLADVVSDHTGPIPDLPFGAALLALSSDPSPGEVVIIGMSMDQACTEAASGDDPPPSGAAPWQGDVCALLSDVDVAAAMGGRPPTSTEPTNANTVAADGYGGASCRWKVSVADHLILDVFPAANANFEELAAYDPHDRWLTEGLAGVGDEAWVQRWNADSALPIAPGAVGAIVVRQGDLGLRLQITAGYPAEPDGLIGAAQVILDAAG
jgi:hypothetical protein